jgi:hypothetical protein
MVVSLPIDVSPTATPALAARASIEPRAGIRWLEKLKPDRTAATSRTTAWVK